MKKEISRIGRLMLGLVLAASFFAAAAAPAARAAEIVDRTVATVDDGVGATELITYSDLLWELALQPNISIAPPSSEELNRALRILIDQRLIALEAERLPKSDPSEAEIREKIRDVLAGFPSTAEFEKRLRQVGFESVNDDNFVRMMAQRVKIEKYLDFRFRSFVVITPEEEKSYYDNDFVPDFRARYPGVLVPSIDDKRVEIDRVLTEQKVAREIERFLDDAKRRATVTVLAEV